MSLRSTLRTLCLLLLPSMPVMAASTMSPTPVPPALHARSALLLDHTTGTVLASINAHQPMEPASMAKLMTVYVAEQEIRAGRLQYLDRVPISARAWKAEGSKMFVKVGESVTVSDLLRGIIVQSGNDASIALAEHIAGSESAFVDLMNYYAEKIGMTQTHFTNATGLPDPALHTTAADLALLARRILDETDPDLRAIYGEKWFKYQNIRQPNRNRLLWDDLGVDGLKTGHTDTAGYGLVATAQRDTMRLISVVMGSKNDHTRTEDSRALIRYGFRFFETRTLLTANTPAQQARIWCGTIDTIPLGLPADLTLTLPKGRHTAIEARALFAHELRAPIAAGAQIGTLVVRLDGTILAERPLIALEAVPKASFWKCSKDRVRLLLARWFPPIAAS